MSCLNRVYISGNLTRDPQLKELPGGARLAELGLAINERFETRKGEPVERTVFLEIVAWERQAEISAEHLRKGSRIAVEGSLQQDTWEDKEGRRQSRLRIRAERVLILQRAREASEPQAPAPTREAVPPSRKDRQPPSRRPDGASESRRTKTFSRERTPHD